MLSSKISISRLNTFFSRGRPGRLNFRSATPKADLKPEKQVFLCRSRLEIPKSRPATLKEDLKAGKASLHLSSQMGKAELKTFLSSRRSGTPDFRSVTLKGDLKAGKKVFIYRQQIGK